MAEDQIRTFVASIHDKMTECIYPGPLTSFETNAEPEVAIGMIVPWRSIYLIFPSAIISQPMNSRGFPFL